MKLRFLLLLLTITLNALVYSQNSIQLKAKFDVPNKTIHITQSIKYQNTSTDTLKTIYLNDWNNSYSTKKTPLALRFAEEFNNKVHFAKSKDRGYTIITSLIDNNQHHLNFSTVENHPDVIKVELQQALLPSEFYDITLEYKLILPSDTFTGYGIDKIKDFNLKYWYLTPSVYDGRWQYYSNKNLNDLYVAKADVTLEIEFPLKYILVSELNTVSIKQNKETQTVFLHGKDRVNTNLILSKLPSYKFVKTDHFTIISNIESEGLSPAEKALITDKITSFISENLGDYPHERLLITKNDYKKDPLYGLNQLPNFIRPFPNNFQYELKLLKTSLNNYLENILLTNPRKDYWLKDALQIYFLMKYVETYYQDTKLIGTLAKVWGIRSFHAADLPYNYQYNLFFMQMARTNRDQPLTTPKDSLIKFNANIAGKYKAGIGLKYLDDFINANILEETISKFLATNKLQQTSSNDFENFLNKQTDKDIDWFFTDYINSRKKIDFRIKEVSKTQDSIRIIIQNKKDNTMPISLFTLNNDSIVSKTWIENINGSKTVTIPRNEANKLALNYDNTIPEYNLRDNWKSLKGGYFFNDKPLQIRLIKDIEDPHYNQLFVMPEIEFNNIYDGITLGAKFYNKTLLRKRLSYKISPQYATKSKSLTGGVSVLYTHHIENKDLFNINYGFKVKHNSFAEDSFVTIFTPSLSFAFRDNDDFRSKRTRLLHLRYLSITRNIGNEAVITLDEPDYSVVNLRYVNSDPGLINHSRSFYDLQFAKDFGKLAFNYQYRKLSETNRQFSVRLFAGLFLYNNTETSSDYFSFALDRPTDYLFDYNYLGRSEDTGIFSQQLIIAEGGFKSKLETPFANQWMTTANVSASIWRYIQAYGDFGFLKNKGFDPKVVYDSGIRLNLVQDYFELYFPIYSNQGWEIGQPNYDQKIRFIFTVDPQTLLGLFRRKWY